MNSPPFPISAQSPLMLSVSSAPIGYISKAFSIAVFIYVLHTTITQHTVGCVTPGCQTVTWTN